MTLLDTNYLIRFLTDDIKSFAQEARKIFETDKEIYISSLSIAEAIYFLGTQYKKAKQAVCEQMLNVINFPNVKTASFVQPAIQIYSIENVSFYDCVILSEALEKRATLKTLDKKLAKIYKKYSQN